jgi:hypothetical protein
MKEREKEKGITIHQYMYLGAAILLLSGLTLFLFACEKEALERGGLIVVDFSVGSAEFDAGEEVLRGANEELESAVVTLDDEWCVSVTLRPEPVEEVTGTLRAAVPLVENQKVCLAAYTSGDPSTTPVSDATYTYIGGKLVADNDQPLGVAPGTYDFVAYSYYKTANEVPATSNIHPNKDLVWAKIVNIPISETNRSINIVMKPKFARIRASVRMGNTLHKITEVTTVKVEGYKYANLTSIKDGTLSGGSDLTYTAGALATTSFSYQRTEATPQLFYLNPTKMTIGTLKITLSDNSTRTFTDVAVPLSTGLAAGVSYTVVARIYRNPWSFSNIYWDGNKLTFSETPATAHLDYQGVFFKWGSLIGIAPDGNGYIYVPDVVTYPNGAGSTTGAWNRTYVGSSTWGSYAGIPYGSIANDYGNYKGDICTYISGNKWFIADQSTFAGSYGTCNYGSSLSPSADGKTSMTPYVVTYNGVGYTSFPVSGYYGSGSEGSMYPVGFQYMGSWSYYWTQNGSGTGRAYAMAINYATRGMETPMTDNAYPVRCVRN